MRVEVSEDLSAEVSLLRDLYHTVQEGLLSHLLW